MQCEVLLIGLFLHAYAGKKRSKVAVIVPVVVVGILTLAICLVFLWRRMKKRKGIYSLI